VTDLFILNKDLPAQQQQYVTGLSKNATQPREQHSMQPDGPSVTVSLK
jgi:hypothetical protein